MAKPFEGRPGTVAHRLRQYWGQPMIHHDNASPDGHVCLNFRSGNEAMVATGPSTLRRYHNRITERLEGRVKGLTPVFPALLLTGKLASSASEDFFHAA